MDAAVEVTGRQAFDVGLRSVRDALEELRDGRGYEDRGIVEFHLTTALAFLRGVFPEEEESFQ